MTSVSVPSAPVADAKVQASKQAADLYRSMIPLAACMPRGWWRLRASTRSDRIHAEHLLESERSTSGTERAAGG